MYCHEHVVDDAKTLQHYLFPFSLLIEIEIAIVYGMYSSFLVETLLPDLKYCIPSSLTITIDYSFVNGETDYLPYVIVFVYVTIDAANIHKFYIYQNINIKIIPIKSFSYRLKKVRLCCTMILKIL